jgi:AraC family transcriptional activator of pobA
MALTAAELAIPAQIRAEEIHSALQSRTIGQIGAFGGRAWRALLVESGAAEVFFDVGKLALSGPCLAWVPWRRDTRIRIAAGSVGKHVLLGEGPIANSIGHNAESSELRVMADRPTHLDLEHNADLHRDVVNCFDAILRETATPAAAYETLIEAQTRILLILLWRHTERPDVAALAQAQRILQHFRNLLEIHFRERWHVQQYADAIGISTDRLHDICQRNLFKPPRQLIHERLMHEACLMLERSNYTVEQISGRLGFADVGHFSRFFRKMSGTPPGRYRNLKKDLSEAPASRSPMSYSDWP